MPCIFLASKQASRHIRMWNCSSTCVCAISRLDAGVSRPGNLPLNSTAQAGPVIDASTSIVFSLNDTQAPARTRWRTSAFRR
jgi:hypothetical protein